MPLIANTTPTVKRLKFKLAALVIGVMVALLLGEMILRVFLPHRLASSGREREYFCRYDADLGWAPLENVTARHQKDGRTAVVHQNQFGMRGPDDVQYRPADGRRRVLVLGDSYAWGFGVNQKELFSAPEVHGTDDEILNFGVSGYGTDQECLLYLLRGTNFVVDEVVVALTPYNDIANNLASKQYGFLKPYFTAEQNQLVLHKDHVHRNVVHWLTSALSRHCRVWNLLGEAHHALNELREKRQAHPSTAEARGWEYRPEDITERDRQGVELTVAILKRLRDAAVARRAEFTVVFVPYKPHVDKRLAWNHPLVPLIAAGLAREGISYREPYAAFLQAASAGGRPFNDPDNHFGPEGHALFAKFLTRTELASAAANFYARR